MASKISINLDTSKENYLVAKCKQNDDLVLEAFIYENGLALDLTNKSITIQALKADNTYIVQNTDITKTSNKINGNLTRDFSRVAGTTKIEIVLIESSKQNTTFSFYLEVVNSVIKGAVESTNTVTILEELENKIVEAGAVKEETEHLITSGNAATKGDVAQINASLEQNTNNKPIYLKDLGVSHLKTASENTTLIKQALMTAYATSRPIIFPWTPSETYIDINEQIDITGSVNISGYGINTRIRQINFPKSIFYVSAPNVTIKSFSLFGNPFNATGMGATFVNYSGISVFASNVSINDINGDTLASVVRVGGVGSVLTENVVVDNIYSNNVCFNLLCDGVKNMKFSNIRGNYKLLTGVATPPHLVYFSDGINNNYDVVGFGCNAIDGKDSYAYQFKGMIGGSVSNLNADGCCGLFHTMNCNNYIASNLTSINDKWNQQDSSSVDIDTASTNVIVDNLMIKLTNDASAIRIVSGATDCKVLNAKVETNHTTNGNTYSYDVSIHGTNNSVKNIDIKNVGTAQYESCIGVIGGNGNSVINPKTQGNRSGVTFLNGVGHNFENYRIDKLGFINGSALSKPFVIYPSGSDNPIVKLYPTPISLNGIGQQDRLYAFERCDMAKVNGATISFMSSGHKWINSFGTFIYNNNRISSSVGSPSLTYISTNSQNIDLSAGIKYADREFLAIRATNKNNMLGVRLNHLTNLLEFYRVDDGYAITVLANSPFTPIIGRRYRMRVQAYNNKIDVYIDGQKLINYTLDESAMTKYTTYNHGIGGNANSNGLFDNIEFRYID